LALDALNSAFEIHNIEILVSFGGGFFCALSNSAANLEPMEMESLAVAMRRNAIALIWLDRSIVWLLILEKSFLKPVFEGGLYCVTDR